MVHSSRIAACLLLVYCAGHTIGGVLAPTSMGPAADDVLKAMKTTHFTFSGSDCTYHGFLYGSGLLVSIFLLLSALIAWTLGAPAPHPLALRPIAWGLLLAHILTTILSFKYFFAGPGVLGIVICILLGITCVKHYAY